MDVGVAFQESHLDAGSARLRHQQMGVGVQDLVGAGGEQCRSEAVEVAQERAYLRIGDREIAGPALRDGADAFYSVRQPGYDFGDEFEFELAVILDGLAASISRPDRESTNSGRAVGTIKPAEERTG